MPDNIRVDLGHRYEATQMAQQYRLHPQLLIDDLYRLDNAWAGVMPQQPWSDTYERGFFASNFGPGSVQGRQGLGAGIAGSNATLYVVLASGVKGGLELIPGVGVATNLLSNLVDLNDRQRADWGNHILSNDPNRGFEVALALSQLRTVMGEMVETYPEPSVRDGARVFLERQQQLMEDRGVTPAEKATKNQIAEGAPTAELKQSVKALANDDTGTEVDDETFDEGLTSLGEEITRSNAELLARLAPLLDKAAIERTQRDWTAYESSMAQARGWAGFVGNIIAVSGDPAGGARFAKASQAGIDLVSSVSLLSRDFEVNGAVNAVALSSGVGAAFALYEIFQQSTAEDPNAAVMSMLSEILGKLNDIAAEIRQIHVLIGDLLSFGMEFRVSVLTAVAQLRQDLAELISLYTSNERQRLFSEVATLTAAAQLETASAETIEEKLAEIATRAFVEGCQAVHVQGPGIPYGAQYAEALADIFNANHAEAFAGIISDALIEIDRRCPWIASGWTVRAPTDGIPADERFDHLLRAGPIVGPGPIAIALNSFRKVLRAHPAHQPADGGPALTSADAYHALVRAAVWINGLYVAADRADIVGASIVSVHVQFSALVKSIHELHQAYLRARGEEASKLPPEILFGLWPYVTNDWTTWTFRTLQTLWRMQLTGGYNISGIFQTGEIEGTCLLAGRTSAQAVIVTHGRPDGFDANWYDKLFKEIGDELDVKSEIARRCAPYASLARIIWIDVVAGTANFYVDWAKTNSEFLRKTIVPRPPQLEERSKAWARESIAGAASDPRVTAHLKQQIDAVKRSCIQAATLIKNSYPGMRKRDLPLPLINLMDAAASDFHLFEDVTKCFYGAPFNELLIFSDPPVSMRLPPNEITVTEFPSIKSLMQDAAIIEPNGTILRDGFAKLQAKLEAGLLGERPQALARVRDVPDNDPSSPRWGEIGALRSATCRGELSQEMSYQLSRALLP
jgi:hypothetical protein